LNVLDKKSTNNILQALKFNNVVLGGIMKKLLVIIFALSFICGVSAMAGDDTKAAPAGGCPYMQKTANASMASAKDGEQVVMLNVSNMTCNGCVAHVTKALSAVDGVSDVKVSLEKGTAEVKFATAKVQPEMLTAAVVKAGYPAQFADAQVTTADAKGCDPAACKAKGCDPAACKTKAADGKCDPAACKAKAADGKCDPAACKAKMASTTGTAKGATCDYKKGACTGAPDKDKKGN
jgi:copper chaperone